MNRSFTHILTLVLLLAGFTANAQVKVHGDVYGGGALANVGGTSTVLVDQTGVEVEGDVYGGGLGRLANTSVSPAVTAVAAEVAGAVQVTVNTGKIRSVYGCNNINGAPQSTVHVDIFGTTAVSEGYAISNVFGGGNQAAYSSTNQKPHVTVHNCSSTIGNVFGSGNQATVPGTDVTIYGGTIGDVYGGGNEAGVTTTAGTTVNIFGGNINRVFAGNNAGGTIPDNSTMIVTVDKRQEEGHAQCEMHINELYGGGNAIAGPAGTLAVQCTGGADEGINKVFGGANAANITNDINLNLSQGRIFQGIYGGNNSSGTVQGNITLTLSGNTSCNVPFPDVFGGGYGEDTRTSGNVTVTVGATTGETQPTMNGDIYGGSALGEVNDAATDKTTVNIYGGTINRNVYGGGLGEANEVDAQGAIVTDNSAKGKVNGEIEVNIGKIDGSNYVGNATFASTSAVYGCNNTNGSPQADVTVNVYNTKHTDGVNNYPSIAALAAPTGEVDLNDLEVLVANPDAASYSNKFALQTVYGGGNKASYTPPLKSDNTRHSTTVHIYDCALNTVKTVYGGGNAANVGTSAVKANTNVIIEGGFIDRVFGGGNGYSASNNHDKPYKDNNGDCTATQTDTPCDDYNPGANIFGKATTVISGGLYRQVFGGNNQYGDVDEVDLAFNDSGSTCDLLIHESFGGANEADIHGDVTTNLRCSDLKIGNFYGGSNLADIISGDVTLNVYGGTYNNIFGGSKGRVASTGVVARSADITDDPATLRKEGNVTLNLFGGTINNNVFGGSDVLGGIDGVITVNVLDFELTDCPLSVKNIYGGGNLTAYEPKADVIGDNPSPVVNVIHVKSGSSVSGNVFGGAYGADATVKSNPKVTIGYDASMGTFTQSGSLLYTLKNNPDPSITYAPATLTPASFYVAIVGNVYGGGDLAAVEGSTAVTIQHNHTNVAQDVYGGGALANVKTNTSVTLSGGTVRMAFGGGMGNDVTAALVEGSTALTANGTTINGAQINTAGTIKGGVFGGCNVNGTVSGTSTVTITNTVGANDNHVNVYGGGLGVNTDVKGDVAVNVGANVFGDVYGGSAKGLVTVTGVTLTAGTVTGDIYGGGHGLDDASANVKGAVTVSIKGGTVNDVYGGNNVKGSPLSTVQVDVEGGIVNNNVYGGGNVANYTGGSPVVNIKGGTVTQNVFGGGNQAGVGTSSTTTQVNVSGGTVGNGATNTYGIYGGCNEEGTVTGAIAVNITGGTLGTTGTGAYNLKGVFGGGFGDATRTAGNVTVTIGDKAGTKTPTVYGDIYGGSALGWVNTDNSHTTRIDFLNGTLYGNIYGGGLGETDNTDKGKVNGQVQVNIGASDQDDAHCFINIAESKVFGCNNSGGSPQDDVQVNIYRTGHGNAPATNAYPTLSSGSWTVALLEDNAEDQAYAIKAVYGGGNMAPYIPATPHNTTVHVYNCNNTIEDVYGGGNAANVGSTGPGAVTANTNIIIDGGRMHRVFGGGKGVKGDVAANIYGTATTTINAGLIDQIFGGGDQNGSITTASLNLNHSNSGTCPDELFLEVFGGANEATLSADLTTGIACGVGTIRDVYGGSNAAHITGDVKLNIEGGTITNAFGGSKGDLAGLGNTHSNVAANILAGSDNKGNVTLNLFGGTITNAYGGSNYNGNIQGKIVVNMFDKNTSGCGLTVHNIYGAGNLTSYQPNNANLASPEVNLFQGTVSKDGTLGGNVFGGAKGGTLNPNATVTANPKVTIGYDATMTLPDGVTSITKSEVTVAGNVYGGGDEAAVTGTTTVKMQQVATTATLTSTSSTVTGDIYGGGNNANVSSSTTVTVEGGTANGDVYGGGAFANTGATTVNILGGTLNSNIYGGGLGDNTHSPKETGTVTVNIGTGQVNPTTGAVTGVNGAATFGANSAVYGCNNAAGSPQGDVYVNVFQTGHRQTTTPAYNDYYDTGTNYAIKKVFGGGRAADYAPENDLPSSTKRAHVNIYTCENTIEDVFGGGDAAAAVGVVTVVKGGRFNRIFGGGNGESIPADIGGGGVTLTIMGGKINMFFGGSNQQGYISGELHVTATSGDCDLDITDFFCGSNKVPITGSVNTVIRCNDNMKVTNLYGGSNLADIGGDVSLTVEGGEFTNVFGGSKGDLAKLGTGHTNQAANIGGNVTLNLYGGVIENAFGGSDVFGNIAGKITVNVLDDESKDGSIATCPLYINNVYGGGRDATYTPTASAALGTNFSPEVNVIHGTIDKEKRDKDGVVVNGTDGKPILVGGFVFGGGLGDTAVVVANPKVNIGYDATTMSSLVPSTHPYKNQTDKLTAKVDSIVFGGGDRAAVAGYPQVVIQKSNSSAVSLFGGGNQASVGGASVDVLNGSVSRGVYGGCNVSGSVGGANGKITSYTSTTTSTATGTVTNISQTSLPSTGSFTGAIEVNVKSNLGSNTKDLVEGIYGGGKGENTRTIGNVTVTVDKATSGATAPVIYGDVYGGSALGWVGDGTGNDLTKVDFKDGTLHGYIFGGGMGDGTNAAMVKGAVQVDITTGSITDGVYGGCNERGTVTGDITVNAKGGTVGTSATSRANIHGGGLGNNTATTGDIEVSINGVTVYGDVYGGSGYGNVNASGDTTTVNVVDGTIYGDVYGGGLGNTSPDYAALVNGKVFVNIGAKPASSGADPTGNAVISTYKDADNKTHGGNVFGCNNANGSPQDSVFVNIYNTKHDGNAYPTSISTPAQLATNANSQAYAIQAVYGGGNLAAYTPTQANNKPRSTTVHVYGCKVNTVKEVYGGGNAANVGSNSTGGAANTFVYIDGGRINKVFGGGKGVKGSVEANIYGTATTTIYGGLIDTIFGGSNQNGSITSANLYFANTGSCTDKVFNQVFGGANVASISGDLATTINCGTYTFGEIYGGSNLADITGDVTLNIKGGTYNNVFGGSKGKSGAGADIDGNVELNLEGGTITNAFGGSNVEGNITGTIAVNVLDQGSCTLQVDTIYGGGQDASYTPNELKVNGKIVASPLVCLKHGTIGHVVSATDTVPGCVFGGGKGITATVNANANPKVMVGDGVSGHSVTVLGNVFGGGNKAETVSTDTILMQGGQVANLYGGGNRAGAGKTVVKMSGGTVKLKKFATLTNVGDIYGGCNFSGTVGTTTKVELTGGLVEGSVFGGGFGSGTEVTGKAIVEISGGSNTTVKGDVYGGGNEGEVKGGAEVKIGNN